MRGQYLTTPRDNLVFELGLFIGGLGAHRVFLLHPRDHVDLPSDLQGITPITYRTDREDKDTQNAVNPAATEIRNAVKRIGRRRPVPIDALTLRDAQSEVGKDREGVVARLEVLIAISRLGGVAAQTGATLGIKPSGGRFEIGVVDKTRLGTSVVVDLNDEAAVGAIERLGESL